MQPGTLRATVSGKADVAWVQAPEGIERLAFRCQSVLDHTHNPGPETIQFGIADIPIP